MSKGLKNQKKSKLISEAGLELEKALAGFEDLKSLKKDHESLRETELKKKILEIQKKIKDLS